MYSYSWVKLKTGVKENNLPADPKQRRVVGLGKKKKKCGLDEILALLLYWTQDWACASLLFHAFAWKFISGQSVKDE